MTMGMTRISRIGQLRSGSRGDAPLALGALGDLTTLQVSGLNVGSHNFVNGFDQQQLEPPNVTVVAFVVYTNAAFGAALTSISVDGQAMAIRASRAPVNAALPGVAVATISPTVPLGGDVELNFDLSDVSAIGTFLYTIKTDGTGEGFNSLADGSPFWRVPFDNPSSLDLAGVSVCVVNANDGTIADVDLFQGTFPGSVPLTPDLTTGDIRWRMGAHRNQPGLFEHQWEGGISGDDAILAFYQVETL